MAKASIDLWDSPNTAFSIGNPVSCTGQSSVSNPGTVQFVDFESVCNHMRERVLFAVGSHMPFTCVRARVTVRDW